MKSYIKLFCQRQTDQKLYFTSESTEGKTENGITYTPTIDSTVEVDVHQKHVTAGISYMYLKAEWNATPDSKLLMVKAYNCFIVKKNVIVQPKSLTC